MISNLTHLMTAKTGTADLALLVEQLAKRADLNRDGQVSKAEFAEFLETVLKENDLGGRFPGRAGENDPRGPRRVMGPEE